MNNKIELINFCVDCNVENVDADDLGSRIVDVISRINSDVLYLLKVKTKISQKSSNTLKSLLHMFQGQGINNIVIIPIDENWIKDVTLEEVRITNENQ